MTVRDALVQTAWAELLVASLADAGVELVALSPGSRSTPLVAALAREPRLEVVTIVDERAAAFYALGAARRTGRPAALACTSGTAAAHYLPAIVEASVAGIPLIAITADRPSELLACGASQTIDQVKLYGDFVRASLDVGAPAGSALALRALRRKVVQAATLARGPHPGPVHLEVPLRKPLEPVAAETEAERAVVELARALRGPIAIAPPGLAADPGALATIADALAAHPRGAIVIGALPVDVGAAIAPLVAELAARTGHVVIAESGSQLRLGPAGDALAIDTIDLIPVARRPRVDVALQLGGEPVAASWPAWLPTLGARHVIAEHAWLDPDSSARTVAIGALAPALAAVLARLGDAARPDRAYQDAWRACARGGARAIERALADHPTSEAAVVRAIVDTVGARATLQIGNSLPIRVIDQVARRGGDAPAVITQRGAAGIDGLIAGATGAAHATGAPVVLVVGDVAFLHDLGALAIARAGGTVVIVVIDNAGGQIFAGLPIARAASADLLARYFTTAPGIDPVAVAAALGLAAVRAETPAAVATAVADALARGGATVVHAPVPADGAHAVRRAALEYFTEDPA